MGIKNTFEHAIILPRLLVAGVAALHLTAQPTLLPGSSPCLLSYLAQAHVSVSRLDRTAGLKALSDLSEEGSISEGRALLKQLLDEFPRDVKVHLAAANFYRRIGLSAAAVAEYKTVLLLDPTYAKAYTDLAEIYLANGNERESQSYARKALLLSPKSQQAQLVLVNILLKKGDLRAADRELGAVLKEYGGLNTQNADFAYVAYQLDQKRGKYVAARKYLDQAIALRPKRYQWLLDKADISKLIGDSEGNRAEYIKAKQALMSLLKVDTYSVEALSKLGRLLEYDLGELDGAMECYQKLLAIDPENVVALTGIDRLKAKRNDIAGQMKSIFWETIAEYRRVLVPQHTE